MEKFISINLFICNFHLFHRIEESPLPDGTYPISLSQATQERFECVAEWDLSILEPQKIVQLEQAFVELEGNMKRALAGIDDKCRRFYEQVPDPAMEEESSQ